MFSVYHSNYGTASRHQITRFDTAEHVFKYMFNLLFDENPDATAVKTGINELRCTNNPGCTFAIWEFNRMSQNDGLKFKARKSFPSLKKFTVFVQLDPDPPAAP